MWLHSYSTAVKKLKRTLTEFDICCYHALSLAFQKTCLKANFDRQ